MRTSSPVKPFVASCLVVIFAVGCAGDQQTNQVGESIDDEELPQRARNENLTYEELEVERVDLNGDDDPDQWTYSRDGQTVRVERDMNFDGTMDVYQYYNSEGELIEEEMNLDHTTHIDVVAFYSDGQLERKELATEFDGSFPIEQFFNSEEELLRVERDSDGDGQVDVWEYYEDGERARIGWDSTGDGQPDTFNQL